MTPLLAGILAYVALQLAVGVWASRRIASEDDYFVAGRRLGPGLAAVSVFATWFGAETCVSAAGGVRDDGLRLGTVEPFAYGVCLFFTGALFAAPLWRRGIITLSDFFRERFGQGAERVSAFVLLPSSIFWAAAQLRAFAEVLAASGDGLSLEAALAIAAAIAIGYTVLGGLLADVWTDGVQAAVLVLGLAVVAAGVVVEVGGPRAAWSALPAAGDVLRRPPDTSWLAMAELWAIPIIGSVLAQEVLARSFAARSAGAARGAGLLGGALYLLIGAVPVTLALIAPSLEGSASLPGGDAFLPALAREYLPAFLYVLFAGALVSAILSTVDSSLLVAGSLLARNVVGARANASEGRKLLLARLGVVLAGLVAWRLAGSAEDVFTLVQDSSAFGSAGIVVAVTLGLTTRAGGPASAVAAMLVGTGVWAWGDRTGALAQPFLAALAAALASYLALAALQRLTRNE